MAAFPTLLAREFRRQPLRVAQALWPMLQTHPVVAFQAAVLLRFPTGASAGMFFLGALANHLLVNLVFLLRAAKTWAFLHKEIRGTFGGFTFRPFLVSSYLADAKADYADMDYWMVKRMYDPSASLDDVVKVHVWRKPGTVVSNLASYSLPYGYAFVFLSDRPGKLSGARRFQVLHEIGHAVLRIAASSAFVELGLIPGLYFLAWFALMAEWTPHALVGALAYAAVLGVWRGHFEEQREVARLSGEIAADGFAVGYLSPEDCRAALDSERLPVLRDRTLSELHNAVRLERLRRLLELRAGGKDKEALALAHAEVPGLGLGAPTPTILLTMALGFYAAAPTGRTVVWTAVLVGAITLINFFLGWLLGYFHRHIQLDLQARAVPDD